MRRLRLTTTARRDLGSINDYLLSTSGQVEVARGFIRQLQSRCRRLAELPGTLGTAHPELGTGVRAVAQGNYLILFRYEPGLPQVLRFIEGHREVERAFGSEDS